MNMITDHYYDNRTYDMLLKKINNDDKVYIQTIGESIEKILYERWNNIVNSLPANYYEQYASMQTQKERNDWFQRYLDLPTKDMSLMPDIL